MGQHTMTDNDREQDTRLERLYIISSFEAKMNYNHAINVAFYTVETLRLTLIAVPLFSITLYTTRNLGGTEGE